MRKTEDGRIVSNNQLKKEEAHIHNKTLEISQDIMACGECKCGGSLFMYLKSDPENYFKVYCTDCESQSDVRTPKKGDIIWSGPSKVIDYIAMNAYGEDEIAKHMSDPSCANRKKRESNKETQLLKAVRFDGT